MPRYRTALSDSRFNPAMMVVAAQDLKVLEREDTLKAVEYLRTGHPASEQVRVRATLQKKQCCQATAD